MTEEQKNTQEKHRNFSEGMPFAAMLQKMMGRRGSSCDCADMMSQMIKTCCQSQAEEEKPVTKKNQKA